MHRGAPRCAPTDHCFLSSLHMVTGDKMPTATVAERRPPRRVRERRAPGGRPSPGLVCAVDNRQYWTWCQTYHLFGDTAQEHVSPPSTLVCPHDDEIGVALMGDAHNSVCRRPDRDFYLPGPIEGVGHEVAELGQSFLIVVIGYNSRLPYYYHWAQRRGA